MEKNQVNSVDQRKSDEEKGIGAFAVNNMHMTIVIFLIVSLLGIVSLFKLPKDLLPSANMPAVQIVTFYPAIRPHQQCNITPKLDVDIYIH